MYFLGFVLHWFFTTYNWFQCSSLNRMVKNCIKKLLHFAFKSSYQLVDPFHQKTIVWIVNCSPRVIRFKWWTWSMLKNGVFDLFLLRSKTRWIFLDFVKWFSAYSLSYILAWFSSSKCSSQSCLKLEHENEELKFMCSISLRDFEWNYHVQVTTTLNGWLWSV